jgi:hypothetical protein
MRSRAGAPYLLGVQCAESMMQGRTASLSTATRALLKQLQVELDSVKLIAASFAGGGAAYRCKLSFRPTTARCSLTPLPKSLQ